MLQPGTVAANARSRSVGLAEMRLHRLVGPLLILAAVALLPLTAHPAAADAICRDGTYSYSEGRGTCSWHGGVDHWIYNEVQPDPRRYYQPPAEITPAPATPVPAPTLNEPVPTYSASQHSEDFGPSWWERNRGTIFLLLVLGVMAFWFFS